MRAAKIKYKKFPVWSGRAVRTGMNLSICSMAGSMDKALSASGKGFGRQWSLAGVEGFGWSWSNDNVRSTTGRD